MPRGGKREGAGRKSKRDKYEPKINRAEGKIADRLPDFVDNVIALADGGFERITEVLEPAGTVMIDATVIETSGSGEPKAVKVKKPAFPDLPPEELVVVRVTRTTAAPDLGANQYLLDRIMGRPTQPHEFANLSDEELIQAATAAFGGDDQAGPESPGH